MANYFSMIKIAVLLTCYNRKENTISCLKSLYNAIVLTNSEVKFDIFLVDDGSTDGTSDEVHAYYTEINVIQGTGDLYWNRGMNLAWQTAAENNYDFYLWLNNDVDLFPNSINIILNDSELRKNKSIITGACRSKDGRVTYSGFNNLKEKKKIVPFGMPIPCDYFNGNVVLVPSIVFEQIGYLNPIFHHAQGDFEYGLRAKKNGIYSFVSSAFAGICESHSELPQWCNPDLSFKKRWENFNSPLGGRPKSTFIFQRIYFGWVTAFFHYFTIHLRLLFPKIWKKVQ